MLRRRTPLAALAGALALAAAAPLVAQPKARLFFDTTGNGKSETAAHPGTLNRVNPQLTEGGGTLYIYLEMLEPDQQWVAANFDIEIDGGTITGGHFYNPFIDTLDIDRWNSAQPDPAAENDAAAISFLATATDQFGITNDGDSIHDLQFNPDDGIAGSTLLGWIDVQNNPGETATIWFKARSEGIVLTGGGSDIEVVFGFGDPPVTANSTSRSTTADASVAGAADPNLPVAICQDVVIPAQADCQAEVEVEAVNNGSTVDPTCGVLSMTLDPAGPYPAGTTQVTLVINDACGQSVSCSATITVTDAGEDPPELDCSQIEADRSADAGQCTFTVTDNSLDPTVTDDCPLSNVKLVNDYNNSSSLAGAVFQLGETTINWTATDAQNNTDTCQVKINVTGATDGGPSIDCSGINASRGVNPGACTYTVPDDSFDPVVMPGCPDDSVTLTNDFNNSSTLKGAVFPIGTTTVNWTASDQNNKLAQCSIAVQVTDTEPPLFTCTGDITLRPHKPSGATVDIDLDVVDDCDDEPTIVCNVASDATIFVSGSTLGIGTTTTVECTANDVSGNVGECTFTIHVQSLAEACDGIIDMIDALQDDGKLNQGEANSLRVKIQNARDRFEENNDGAGCNQLDAFINECNALVNSGRLTSGEAQPMIDAAGDIMNAACGTDIDVPPGGFNIVAQCCGDGTTATAIPLMLLPFCRWRRRKKQR